MKILIVANPVSGGGRAGRAATELADGLERRGHRVELSLTRKAGDAAARVAGELDVDRIVAVGGDGTLNEVINGLPDGAEIPLGQLPTGTANVLAHELNLPSDPAIVARLIERGRTRPVDIARVGTRRFICMTSVGFDALVTRAVHEHRSGTQGYLAYTRPILRALRGYRPQPLRVSLDGGPALDAEWLLVSNTANYGGLFTMADRALCDSGTHDVCLMRRAPLGALPGLVLAGLRGGLSQHPGIDYHSARSIRVSSDDPAPYQVDGDWAGQTPVEIDALPWSVPFLVPRD